MLAARSSSCEGHPPFLPQSCPSDEQSHSSPSARALLLKADTVPAPHSWPRANTCPWSPDQTRVIYTESLSQKDCSRHDPCVPAPSSPTFLSMSCWSYLQNMFSVSPFLHTQWPHSNPSHHFLSPGTYPSFLLCLLALAWGRKRVSISSLFFPSLLPSPAPHLTFQAGRQTL